VASAALYFGAVAARSSSVTSSTLSTAGIRRGCGTTVSRRDRSGRSSVTVKKKRRAETELLMLAGCMPKGQIAPRAWRDISGEIFRLPVRAERFARDGTLTAHPRRQPRM
jgi:hypothetical protein